MCLRSVVCRAATSEPIANPRLPCRFWSCKSKLPVACDAQKCRWLISCFRYPLDVIKTRVFVPSMHRNPTADAYRNTGNSRLVPELVRTRTMAWWTASRRLCATRGKHALRQLQTPGTAAHRLLQCFETLQRYHGPHSHGGAQACHQVCCQRLLGQVLPRCFRCRQDEPELVYPDWRLCWCHRVLCRRALRAR